MPRSWWAGRGSDDGRNREVNWDEKEEGRILHWLVLHISQYRNPNTSKAWIHMHPTNHKVKLSYESIVSTKWLITNWSLHIWTISSFDKSLHQPLACLVSCIGSMDVGEQHLVDLAMAWACPTAWKSSQPAWLLGNMNDLRFSRARLTGCRVLASLWCY